MRHQLLANFKRSRTPLHRSPSGKTRLQNAVVHNLTSVGTTERDRDMRETRTVSKTTLQKLLRSSGARDYGFSLALRYYPNENEWATDTPADVRPRTLTHRHTYTRARALAHTHTHTQSHTQSNTTQSKRYILYTLPSDPQMYWMSSSQIWSQILVLLCTFSCPVQGP